MRALGRCRDSFSHTGNRMDVDNFSSSSMMAGIEKRDVHVAARCCINGDDFLLTGEGDYSVSSSSGESIAVQVMILGAGVLKIASTKIFFTLDDSFPKIPL